MKIAKITIFEDGKCAVVIKDGLFKQWHWGDGFDDLKHARKFAKDENCTFILVHKDTSGYDDSMNGI